MYKFTNGLVVYDKQTRDEYLKAGYKLVKPLKIDKNDSQLKEMLDSFDKDVINDKGEIISEPISRFNKRIKTKTRKG